MWKEPGAYSLITAAQRMTRLDNKSMGFEPGFGNTACCLNSGLTVAFAHQPLFIVYSWDYPRIPFNTTLPAKTIIIGYLGHLFQHRALIFRDTW